MRLPIFLLLLFAPSVRAEPLWDLKKLGEAPKVEWLDKREKLSDSGHDLQ